MVSQPLTETPASDSSGPAGWPVSGPAGWIAAALEVTLKARAPGIHASTPLVGQLAHRVGRDLGLDARSVALLAVSVRVRDIGMVALPDNVVLSTEPLTPANWELVNRHPILGAELLQSLTPLASAVEIVRSHHERWDGDGYPDGRRGDAIPLLSRVIAICDAFVAMASDRPHRRGIGTEAALEHIRIESGTQFDPSIADRFIATVAGRVDGAGPGQLAETEAGEVAADGIGLTGPSLRGRRAAIGDLDLASAIADFELVPAFAPACELALAASAPVSTVRGDLVAAIESDTGVTVAVLRRAQAVDSRHPIANVADAVATLSPSEIQEAIKGLPRAGFPWRTTPLEVLLHRSRIHAQAVTRAADRIARDTQMKHRDDLVVAALLHDVGKLVLSRVRADYLTAIDVRRVTPEKRVRQEQESLSLDHASLGGLLLRRWGLPERLASTIATHHSSDSANEIATYVRLADMVAHHAQGDAVDRAVMLRVAHACNLSTKALRDVMFDLPHSGGSQRRRAERSPLSTRQTEVLRLLAQGKLYKQIAVELDLSVSTVRSHLHGTYEKLAVPDRAQAVLYATEMGWI